MTEELKTPGVIAPPPLLLLVSLVAGFALGVVAPLGFLAGLPAGLRLGLGALLTAGAILLAGAGAGRFRRAHTPVVPYRTPTTLVADGVFAKIRNPMYVGFYLFSLGLALLFAADWVLVTTAGLAVVIHYGVVRKEERFLEKLFGAPYADYRRRVRRYGLF